MKYFLCLLSLLLAPLACAWDASQLVVVYNADSQLSRSATATYCRLRGVPENQCVGLSGLKAGDINRKTFEENICLPLMKAAQDRGWRWPAGNGAGRKRMMVLLLMPDLPLRVAECAEPNKRSGGQFQNCASVDSELMLLGAKHPISGPLNNPYFQRDVVKLDTIWPELLVVCRIDAPNRESIMRMIQDPVEVEKRGLWGWTLVDEGGPYPQGDKMFAGAAELASAAYQPLFRETSKQTLSESFPLMPQTAVYFGWYTEFPNGPFKAGALGGFRFAPGAISCHLHSFSATSIKDPNRWVGALLMRGAAVTAGNVYEPYLDGCLEVKTFYVHLLRGETLAEATLAATRWVSWQNVMLGDPLYRPYAVARADKGDPSNPFVRWRRLCKESQGNAKAFTQGVNRLVESPQAALYAEIYAWFCAEAGQAKPAARNFGLAAQKYVEPRDRIRAMLMQAVCEKAQKNQSATDEIMRRCATLGRETPYLPSIAAMFATLSPDINPFAQKPAPSAGKAPAGQTPPPAKKK